MIVNTNGKCAKKHSHMGKQIELLGAIIYVWIMSF